MLCGPGCYFVGMSNQNYKQNSILHQHSICPMQVKVPRSSFLKGGSISFFTMFNNKNNFNAISTRLGLFYATWLENRVHSMFIFTFLCSYLRVF